MKSNNIKYSDYFTDWRSYTVIFIITLILSIVIGILCYYQPLIVRSPYKGYEAGYEEVILTPSLFCSSQMRTYDGVEFESSLISDTENYVYTQATRKVITKDRDYLYEGKYDVTVKKGSEEEKVLLSVIDTQSPLFTNFRKELTIEQNTPVNTLAKYFPIEDYDDNTSLIMFLEEIDMTKPQKTKATVMAKDSHGNHRELTINLTILSHEEARDNDRLLSQGYKDGQANDVSIKHISELDNIIEELEKQRQDYFNKELCIAGNLETTDLTFNKFNEISNSMQEKLIQGISIEEVKQEAKQEIKKQQEEEIKKIEQEEQSKTNFTLAPVPVLDTKNKNNNSTNSNNSVNNNENKQKDKPVEQPKDDPEVNPATEGEGIVSPEPQQAPSISFITDEVEYWNASSNISLSAKNAYGFYNNSTFLCKDEDDLILAKTGANGKTPNHTSAIKSTYIEYKLPDYGVVEQLPCVKRQLQTPYGTTSEICTIELSKQNSAIKDLPEQTTLNLDGNNKVKVVLTDMFGLTAGTLEAPVKGSFTFKLNQDKTGYSTTAKVELDPYYTTYYKDEEGNPYICDGATFNVSIVVTLID